MNLNKSGQLVRTVMVLAMIRTTTLLDPTKGFLVEDRLIFDAEVYTSSVTSSSRVDEIEEAPATLTRYGTAFLSR